MKFRNIIMFSLRNNKVSLLITKTHLYKYIENFTTKNSMFSDKKSDIFHRGYSLEPPQQGGSNEYPQSMF